MWLTKCFLLEMGIAFFVVAASATDLRRVLPSSLEIREGEEIQIRLTRSLTDTTSCYLKTPWHASYNLASEDQADDQRIRYWTENGECGARIANVSRTDEGRWKLIAKNDTETLVDAAFVRVLDQLNTRESIVTIESGLSYELSLKNESKYCTIEDPASSGNVFVGGECKIEIDRPTGASRGTWSATVGVVGQIGEITTSLELNVLQSRLDSGFTVAEKSGTVYAYCNLRNNVDGLDFCRFVKPDEKETGFQLAEGLRNGKYGYYGAGLASGECGISIEDPDTEDYGQWKCTVGLKSEGVLGALVEIRRNTDNVRRSSIEAKALATNAVTTKVNGTLDLECRANVPLSYCWFVSPTDETFAPIPTSTEDSDSLFGYIGKGFGSGECGMRIFKADMKDNGEWTCRMGPMEPGKELTTTIQVRVAETPLAAVNRNIEANDGSLSIECRTVPNNVALEYCRFLMPDGTGIHVTDEITQQRPLILDGRRYWFTGIDLRFGGCGLTVDQISSIHFGKWECAARLDGDDTSDEARDTILVERIESGSNVNDDRRGLTATAATGIATGVLVLLGLVVAATVYSFKKVNKNRQQDNFSEMDMVSVNSVSSGDSTSTNSTRP